MKHRFPSPGSLLIGVALFAVTWGIPALLLAAQGGPGLPRRAADWVQKGIHALEQDDTVAARTAFERALRVFPSSFEAHTYLGVLDDRAGDLAGAEGHFAKAARLAPRSASARNNYGAVLVKLGKAERAVQEFEASLRLDPRQPSALINLAQLRAARGTPDDLRTARDLFTRADAIAPEMENSRALVLLALRLGEREPAVLRYREYSGRAAAQPSAAKPSDRAELGATLLAAGLVSEATEELQAATHAEPDNVDATVLLSRAWMAQKNVPAAGRTLESSVARGVEAAPIYSALVEVYEASGNLENAIPAMRRAIELNPKNEDYRFRYAMLLIHSKAPEAAVIRMEEALKEFPRSPQLWFALGLAHFADHKNEASAQSFERAIEVDPKFAPALAYRGLVYVGLGKMADAILFYERALAADEKLAVTHHLLGDALTKLTPPDLARAERHLKRAVELDPSFSPAGAALGKLYLETERFEEAVTELKRVVAQEPGLAEAHYHLGRAYMRLKRKDEAQAAMAEFQRLSDEQRNQAVDERQDLVRRLANVRF